MKTLYNIVKSLLVAFALGTPLVCVAGNIPQYQVSKGGNPYSEFSDGTIIPCQWNVGTVVIFPNDYETPNPYKGEGFPIGFEFKFGGQIFNQFVVSSTGIVYLGNGTVDYGGDAFHIGMSPIKHGVASASISYKTTGDSGNRILAIQFKNAVLDESSRYRGEYSLQIRLYESTGNMGQWQTSVAGLPKR